MRHREPMAHHCTWRVGGPVLWLVAESEDAGRQAGKLCSEFKLRLRPWDGPSALVRDGGDDLGWLRFGQPALGLEIQDDAVWLGAQLPVAVAALRLQELGLSGLEMHAGAAGTLAELVRSGALEPESHRVLKGQRVGEGSALKATHHLLAIRLAKVAADIAYLRQRASEAIEKRRGVGKGLPGRILADPKRKTAAERMADAGLCGVRLRDLQIGVHEPNSVINRGTGTTKDLLLLQKLSQDRVKQRLGSELGSELEPRGKNAAAGESTGAGGGGRSRRR
ncbi:MAG: hypothetical protein VX899_05535 [Myxococcota bacterium]|nr:hypothetical protein [Myxococcota bacterium]